MDIPGSYSVYTTSGFVPTLPPAGVTMPEDEEFDEETMLLPGTWGYNKADRLWFYANEDEILTINDDNGYTETSALDLRYAAIDHNHDASTITSGTLDVNRLPVATPTSLGGIKIGSTLSIIDGVVDLAEGAGFNVSADYSPIGIWNFSQTPTVNGSALALASSVSAIEAIMSTDSERLAAVTALTNAYQSADTALNNTLTTALTTKLNISDYTAADVLSKLLTIDGVNSGLDADLLDGNHASAFALADHTHTSFQSSVTFGTSIYDGVNNRLGIGITTPAFKLDVFGVGANGGVNTNIGYNITLVTPPDISGMTATAVAGSELNITTYYYHVAYYTALGKTNVVSSKSVTTTAGNQNVQLQNIPISTDPTVIGRVIYRTKTGDSASYGFPIKTIANNVDTSWNDNIPDSSITGTQIDRAVFSQPNLTAKYITINNTRSMVIDQNLTVFGYNAGASVVNAGGVTAFGAFAGDAITSGAGNTLFGDYAGTSITTGYQNVAMGQNALATASTGSFNIAIGPSALGTTNGTHSIAFGYYTGRVMTGNSNIVIGSYGGYSQTTGNYNVMIGHYTRGDISTASTGGNNIFIGAYSGYKETGSNKLIIDSLQRADEATQRSSALIYGTININSSLQTLSLGGGGKVGIGTVSPQQTLDVLGNIGLTGQLISSLADGTAPLSVVSTTLNTNLNADLLDGQHIDYFAPINAPVFTGGATVTGDLHVTGNITAEGEIAAYIVEQVSSSLWDSMPVATATSLGGVKIGSGLTITDGVLSVDNSGSNDYLPLAGGTLTGQLISSLATGTAPINVSSTTVCTNLNADKLDGYDASSFALSAHTHAATDISSGTFDGDRLPAINDTKKGGVPVSTLSGTLFLRDDGTWATPTASSATITYLSSSLSSNVTMTTANTWYNACNITLTSGTWLVCGNMTIGKVATNTYYNCGRIATSGGGTIYVSGEATTEASGGHSGLSVIALNVIITVSVSTTIYLQGSNNIASSLIYATTPDFSTGKATLLNAIKLA